MRIETFAPLSQFDFITHAFAMRTDEDTKSDAYEQQFARQLGFDPELTASAEQPHGNGVVVIDKPGNHHRIAGVDAMTTGQRGIPLVARCADCAAVFIVDRATPAIALIHSGREGTKANVVGNTLKTMKQKLGTDPADCLAFISPSIGPCHYEMDIWAGIENQLRCLSVTDIHNPRVCTACHLDRYFSYRAERGNTGRMLALLALKET